jgi:hypothetical protein
VRYLCLIYDDESTVSAMPPGASDAFMQEYFSFTDAIRKSGHYLGGEALQPVSTATTVRVRNGRTATTDGPFAETKEQLGGFWVIEVADLDAALAWAERCAEACRAPIEVRPFDGLA